MPAANSQPIKTPLARLSYPHLFKKVRAQGSTKEQYSCSLIFPAGTDLSGLRTLAADVAKAQWGDKAIDMIQKGIIRSPFLKGDDPKWADKPAMGPGVVFIRCGAQQKPKVVDQKRLDVDEDRIYPGMYVYAMVHAFAWEHPANGKGVSFGIDAVQIVRDGERLGGGSNVDVNSAFDEIPDEGAAPAAVLGQGAAALFG
jgi:hypothetical protein